MRGSTLTKGIGLLPPSYARHHKALFDWDKVAYNSAVKKEVYGLELSLASPVVKYGIPARGYAVMHEVGAKFDPAFFTSHFTSQ